MSRRDEGKIARAVINRILVEVFSQVVRSVCKTLVVKNFNIDIHLKARNVTDVNINSVSGTNTREKQYVSI